MVQTAQTSTAIRHTHIWYQNIVFRFKKNHNILLNACIDIQKNMILFCEMAQRTLTRDTLAALLTSIYQIIL